MKRTTPFKLFFLILPLLEIAVFIWVGKLIGVGWTLLLIITSTALGIVLLRRQGLKAMQEFAENVRNKQAQPSDVINGSFIVIGGFLLIIPGFITSVIGLLCFTPIIRRVIVKWIILSIGKPMTPPQQQYRVIDVTPKSSEHEKN